MLTLHRSLRALTCFPALTLVAAAAAAAPASSCGLRQSRLVSIHRRTMSSSNSSSSSPKELSPSNLKLLRDYWFEGMPDTLTDEEPMPKASGKKWYMGGDEVDAYCRWAAIIDAPPTHAVSGD